METERPLTAIERFRGVDEYRVGREWRRYEGTAQRELFRVLRERFLRRHSVASGWTLDVGAGPGRFTPFVGDGDARRVAVDVALPMLLGLREHWAATLDRPELARSDARALPFRAGAFAEVVVLGNAVGFAGEDAMLLLETAARAVAPGGRLVVETAPGPGTLSRYLRRLPAGAVVRLLHAPLVAVAPRVTREGYEVFESEDRTRHGFRPIGEPQLKERLLGLGFEVLEAIAVAPGLGGFPERLEDVRGDPRSWERLLTLEEQLGAMPKARQEAAALLLAAARPNAAPSGRIK